MHVTVTMVAFCVGMAVGVVFATACLVFASLYDYYVIEEERRKKCKSKI